MAWNRGESEKTRVSGYTGSKRCGLKGALAGAVVVALSVAAFLALHKSGESEVPSKGVGIAKGSKQITDFQASTNVSVNVATNVPVAESPKRTENGIEVVSSNVRTNSAGAVIEKLVLADGTKMMKVNPPKPIFDNAVDQVIAMAISVKPGQSMPPLPNLDASLEEDFLKSLVSPIVINDSDSEEVKELKAKVKETKAYIVDEIKNGGSLLDVLKAHQEEMERISDNHLMAIQEMQKVREEYGDAAAKEFVREVNESFKVRGIPEIELNPKQETQRNEVK